MQFTYRGTTYETGSHQNSETVAAKPVNNLKYRGVAYRQNRDAQVESMNAVLKYRGADYNPATPETATNSNTSVQEQARQLTIDRQKAERNRQQSVLTRSAAEVGIVI